LDGVGGVERISTADGSGYRLRARDSAGRQPLDLRPAVYNLAREQGWSLKELRRDVRTLEAVFNELAITAEGGAE